jgi:hypothetical protein
MLARATLIVLALASPAWAGPDDYPAGLFEHSPLNDTPAAVSRLRHSSPPQGKLKTRPASAPAPTVIITASGAIRGRNHADPQAISPLAMFEGATVTVFDGRC